MKSQNIPKTHIIIVYGYYFMQYARATVYIYKWYKFSLYNLKWIFT